MSSDGIQLMFRALSATAPKFRNENFRAFAAIYRLLGHLTPSSGGRDNCYKDAIFVKSGNVPPKPARCLLRSRYTI